MKIIENIDNGYEHFLTVGQLREFLENNKNIPDDAKVLVFVSEAAVDAGMA